MLDDLLLEARLTSLQMGLASEEKSKSIHLAEKALRPLDKRDFSPFGVTFLQSIAVVCDFQWDISSRLLLLRNEFSLYRIDLRYVSYQLHLYRINKLKSVFHASFLLLITNFVITLSNSCSRVDPQTALTML